MNVYRMHVNDFSYLIHLPGSTRCGHVQGKIVFANSIREPSVEVCKKCSAMWLMPPLADGIE